MANVELETTLDYVIAGAKVRREEGSEYMNE